MSHPDEWAAADAAESPEEPQTPEPYFPNVYRWFEDFFRPMYRRSYTGENRLWCDEWWRHPEALARLDALWRSWEHLRLEAGLGMSVWWRDHVDPHMAALQSPDGCFKGCTAQRGEAQGAGFVPSRHNPRTAPLGSAPSPLDLD